MKNALLNRLTTRAVLTVCLALLFALATHAQDQPVYTDSLQNSWENWSWAQTNLSATSPVHSGTNSISVVATGTFQAAYFHHAAFSTAGYTYLTFWINGGPAGGQHLQVQGTIGGAAQTAVGLSPLAANTWQQITVPLSSLGMNSGTMMDGFWIQDTSGTAFPVFYLDDITLLSGPAPTPTPTPVPTPTPTPGNTTITVDASANRHPISPLIYGTAFATTAQLLDLNAPLNRSGGNTTTSYNWQQNASNHANDWFFESIADGPGVAGDAGDSFIQTTKNGNAQPAITIPIIDWVAKVASDRSILPSFRVSKYGAQKSVDPFLQDAGNGVKPDGTNVTGNDPNDANVPNSTTLQQGWVQHLLGRWGNASGSGLKYYILDNEHSIWFSTHRDVTPTGMTMDQHWTRMRDYAAMIKAQDPNATIWGPEEWGWGGYLYSGYDQQFATPANGYTHPDRAAHGNVDYMPWLLQQFKNYETANGKRILDVFTLHYYPQANEFGDDVSAPMQALRNRGTRSLWDPNYVDQSWIGTQVKLIPRMKNWVAQNYPGTKIGVTEYNWGAEGNINGATTQADIFGIFGREGIDLATRWTTPATGSPVYNAMKIYRNYDGNKSGFGDTSVSASVANPDNLSAFAAIRSSDGAMTIMIVNKIAPGYVTTINLSSFAAGPTAQVWQMTSANSITHLANSAVTNNTVNITVPDQSITLLVIPAQVLASPSNLTGMQIASAVYLSWIDNTTDEDGFVIERAPASTGVFTELFRAAPNQTRYTAPVKRGSYTYRVRTLRGGFLSDPSNAVQLGR